MSLKIAEHGVVNLTPHEVTVRWGGQERTLPSAGVARLIDTATPVDPIAGLPVVEVSVGEVDGLPEPQPGVVYLVSRLTAFAVPQRGDLVFPFGEIRDHDGRITAVASLGRVATPFA